MHNIKFDIKNGEHLRQKLWAENFESKILSEFKLKQDEDNEIQNNNIKKKIDKLII